MLFEKLQVHLKKENIIKPHTGRCKLHVETGCGSCLGSRGGLVIHYVPAYYPEVLKEYISVACSMLQALCVWDHQVCFILAGIIYMEMGLHRSFINRWLINEVALKVSGRPNTHNIIVWDTKDLCHLQTIKGPFLVLLRPHQSGGYNVITHIDYFYCNEYACHALFTTPPQ
jgi:hypothetical protein